ncbi:trypsin-like serine peptidase [Ottowia thiooxydans]|uniref:Lysyl endopeptidase n=1 Tax=Ottowia thiooxydans TaxID=219182 RepID=A0ABV2QEZ2_9BURK
MKKLHALWAAVAAAALVSCGGGSDSPAPSPTPTPAPTPVAGDRIEPLDTALSPRSTLAKTAVVATKQFPSGAPTPRVSLGPLTVVKAAAFGEMGTALKIGEGREVAATADSGDLAALWSWKPTAEGGQVAAVAFEAEGARAIRLAVLADSVPAGTVLRFYGVGDEVVEMTSDQLSQLRATNESRGVMGEAARMVWGPDTAGAVSTLEVQLPAGVDASMLRLAVPRLSHFTTTVEQTWAQPKDVRNIGAADSCNLDVMCRPDLDTESRSVAKIIYSTSSGAFMCTGTLLNDVRSSRTPYFLTATHCISDQASASTIVAYWFFRASACNSAPLVDTAMTRTTGGADLLYANATIDNTLVKLNMQPPARVVYAGSYFGSGVTPGVGVASVHNPQGDLQKYSVGQVTGYAACTGSTCVDSSASLGARLKVAWQQGVTQQGSSGGPLFTQINSTRYVVGSLWGGAASCQNPNGADYYGRLENSYAAGINRWLN